ncbi:hypothetical protein GCM10012275_47540 [Longimycelium tulufanense]|uniref:Enhanced intracellular survival protein domain-containing protein n=1 Tax=Longimycelium tulufanense TaxID=907463 RepID=A0A8J3FVU1_9PSEU|nr:sterol carrier protein domain-containing protein [Longimycelium tulufanense]GGM71563.1 hypothetical protein GCM10012275_47540 [Longimycelium tulufanense]
MLADRDTVRTTGLKDETWLRLVDVETALSVRSWGAAEPVVLEVRDGVLPENQGCYRIGGDGVTRVDTEPHLGLDVADLGALYLGDVRPSTLAATGRVVVHDPAALALADRLFATDVVPWSGTGF